MTNYLPGKPQPSQFTIEGIPADVSVAFYIGFNLAEMVEIRKGRYWLNVRLDEFLAMLDHAEIRQEAERRKT